MKQAGLVAKHMKSNKTDQLSKVVGFTLSATAPDAFVASQKISDIAMSETGKIAEKVKKNETSKVLPSMGSPQALRESHRLIRSKPKYTTLNPRVMKNEEEKIFNDNSFDSWNPESIDETILSENNSAVDVVERIQNKIGSIEKIKEVINLVINEGVLTSAGSGHRSPVCTLTQRRLESIMFRLTSCVGGNNNENVLNLQNVLSMELEEISVEYCKALASASVQYEIKNPEEATKYGINPSTLYEITDSLWTNKIYQLPEWRVLRQTGINSKNILRTFRVIDRQLCTALPIMLEITNLWLDGSLPNIWWETIHGTAKCNYAELLFTDVNNASFRNKLPLALDDFSHHVDSHGKDIRDALLEHWIVAVGGKLSNYVASLPDEVRLPKEQVDTGFVKEVLEGEENFDEDYDDQSEFQKMKSTGITPQQALKNRLAVESMGVSGKTSDNKSSSKGNISNPKANRNRAENIVDCAVVLLSKQLRGMCEASLQSLASLFEELNHPSSSGFAIFSINMRLRKVATKETTSDFFDPVEVCLSPNLTDLKNTTSSFIHSVVASSRGFSRPEQAIGQQFGGKNNFMAMNMLNNMRGKKMNESSVCNSDEVVHDVTQRIYAGMTTYYEGPRILLENFEILNELFSGELSANVLVAIQACVGAEDTIASLESLALVCRDLDTMIDTIKNLVPDICYFPMFELHCFELKDLLIKQVKFLHTQVMEALAEENRIHMLQICAKYQEIANTLVAEVSDSAELKTLQDFTNKSASTMNDLYDQYITSCYERVRFILSNKFRLARDDIQTIYNTFNWPSNIQTYLKRSYENQSARKRELEDLLEEDQRKLENDVNDINKRVELIADNSSPMDFRKNVERLASIKRDIDVKLDKATEIEERETLLEVPHSDHGSRLNEVTSNMEPLDRLWSTVKMFIEKTHYWHETPLAEIDPVEAERTSDEIYRALMKSSKEFDKLGEKRQSAKKIADSLITEVKEFMAESVPLMLLICNPGMRERHWKDIEALTGISIPKGEVLTVAMCIELGLPGFVKDIEDICISASKEYSLQVAMDKMETEWKEMIFDTKEYRTTGTRILSSVDEIQTLLDDHIVKTQAMRGSRFIKPFIEQITIWEKTLISMQDILDNWLKVQATWLYLEPIFSSDDIMRQMPTEGKMFKSVDNTWRTSMAQTFSDPSCVKVARRPGFLDSLIEANARLEQIQKGLNDYLETKRLAFPRFYFLSNDELLEILAETKDPLRVQPHLKKCFDGISKLKFESNLDITGCFDPKGEKLDFPFDKVNQKKINPNDTGGNVEVWLIEVEQMMKKSLAYAIDSSMKDYLQSDRIDWLFKWQGQVIVAINQTRWCFDVEKVFTEENRSENLEVYYKYLCSELMRTVELVRGDIPKALRIAVGAVVVMDVHNRDTINELCELGITSKTEFDWLAQMRYYWSPDGESAQTGMPATLECYMINAMALYAYEYIGNQDRLVITPLTDRCYRTLMGAIHLNLGGAPEGPAGTGKTETVKDLGKAIAIQCVVTNCSDGLDYLAMAKFFKGLASSGSWACFDEFNRIQLEVLSVVAQQIMQIQHAKAKRLEKFQFEGTELPLKMTCCPFITMNPGYAGRAELPDNLKVLFRTVAMMVPDYAMISEIILYSFGYMNAKPLSVKIVTTYKLCSEQLSSQSHYDYGMRAVISVVRACGNLKRSDGHLPEDVLVLRSIIDVNLPKFLSPDVPLFAGITSDLFPGVKIDDPDRDNMYKSFTDVCLKKNLLPVTYFWDKVVQIYDMMVVRHGFMIVGAPFSGKSSAWKVLGEMLGLLCDRFPEDKRWAHVLFILQNPKSITMGQLYGQFDPVSHEWTDGVLAINYRNAASNKIGEVEDRKWILFDGPVDAIWIENMNTVLDDNKKLCLMSGEIIAMTDVMSMMFEPMDLLVASPATVSRCGMVYMEPERLGWEPFLASWFSVNRLGGDFRANLGEGESKFILFDSDCAIIQSLFDWLVEPCLCFIRKEGIEMSPTVDTNLVCSLLNIFEALLSRAFKKYKNEEGEDVMPTDSKPVKQRSQDLENCFFFSLIWSLGKSGTDQTQSKFSSFLEQYVSNVECIETDYVAVWNALMLRQWKKPDFFTQVVKGMFALPMPKKNDYFECIYIPEESKWKFWADLLPPFVIEPGTAFSHIVVPNNYTAQYAFLIQLLVPNNKHILMCGPTGTGKSVYIANTITTALDQEIYKPLLLGFSAKTSANMTQDIIDGKLDKRRKGVYGPPMGQHAIIFVDDLNMPEVEIYGAQPPIELLRQLIDNGGWYDLKEKSWKSIVDTSLIAGMGPPGGGRNSVTPRFLRHFNLFCFSEFDDNSLRRIFSTIIKWHFESYSFPGDVRSTAESLIETTLDTYRNAMIFLLPTPQKSHYTFNLRDFSRIMQGVLLCKPSEIFNKAALVRHWSHEVLRVFGDRLIDESDRQWLHEQIEKMCTTKLNCNFYETFKHLDTGNKKTIATSDLRNLLLGDYMTTDEPKPYVEVLDFKDLNEKMEEYLADYNGMSKKPMDLVLFSFAIEHVSRINRILKMPGGNALLAGVGGSGRQSATRLATFMCGYDIFQIEISKNYTNFEWREDLKTVLRGAGCSATGMVFLFSDTQIKNETFVEDINNILNSGEVPNIFPSDERAAIAEQVRGFAKQVYGKAAADMNIGELYAFFISRVKFNLHVVLAFSPIGDAFRDRLRKFPALINCCTIDWFTAWPSDALVAVATRFLAPVQFVDERTRVAIVALCQQFHEDVRDLSANYFASLKRQNYVTPTSYLELIIAFKGNLDVKRKEVSSAKMRYEVGLEKLAFAADQVNTMQKELADLQPELLKSSEETTVLMGQIEEKMPGVMATRKIVTAEAEIAQGEADLVTAQKNEVEADLAVAIPALEDAIEALNTIKPNDINEIKALSKPPEKIRMVCRAVCILLDIKPVRIPDPENPSKRIMDYWGPSQKMLSDSEFIKQLFNYDKDHMNPKIVAEIVKDFIEHPDFNPEIIAKASKAAEGMCRWCCAMITYDRVAKVVAPKKAALEAAEAKLKKTMDELNAKKAALKKVEDDLASLETALSDAKAKKLSLEGSATLCDQKIVRANQLLDGLGGERDRWTEFAKLQGEKYKKLTGDVLISAGLLAYLGPFTAVYRQKQMQLWVTTLKEHGINGSESPTLAATLGEPVRIRQWNIDGLPTDGFSIDNGIIVFNARRWPLMIDPQGQANKWIRNMEKVNSLQVIKLTDGNYLRILENSIQFGTPVLLENVGEELDPSLEPLLQKQLFKQGGVNCIRLGDSTVEYSEHFRFYITSKLRNPHYLPEVSVKVTLLNFMITPEGLQDQLLGIVVSQERPDLEEQRIKLIVESAENKRLLKEIEDQILHIMSSSSGNILEDETAITTLKGSKELSNEISAKQVIAEETEININTVRQSYSPVAYSSQILFFCIADLANIEPVYQYSLTWFINLFINSIATSEKGRDVAKRLENLDSHFTYSLYRNVCRSLLEKDKLLFSFLLTSRIMGGKGLKDESEWFFILTGGMGLDNPHPNPAPEWLSAKMWDTACRLEDLKSFTGFRDDFVENIVQWKLVYDSLTPHEDLFPGQFTNTEGLGRLCLLKVIRPDKVVLAVQKFVAEEMGIKFVKPPPFDLQACYNDSSAIVPLVFILSAGSDPMGAVVSAAERLKTHVDPISLGQGQGPKAEALIKKAKIKGTWVVLQNCHLAPSWMTTLEKICEELDPEDTHEGFRLWCTTYPSEVFPVSVLQNGVKMTNEPPKGIRANLLGSFNADPIASDDFYDSCTKGVEFRRLIFGLCFFHALVQERRLYGPLGWNIPYEFNDSDMRISVQQLKLFLNENDTVPFKALVYTAGECNYGGRVTDDKDRRTILCILKRFYSTSFLDDNHFISPSGTFKVPNDGTREDFIEFIDQLPIVAAPEVFGLHDNATLTKDQNDTNALLNSIVDTEGGSGSGSGGPSKEDILLTVAADIYSKLPTKFDMEFAQVKYPVRWDESMNTVLCQELIRFNNLLNIMQSSLVNVQKAVKGLVVMSEDLDIFGSSLFVNRIPLMWKSKSYPSLKNLSGYFADLLERLKKFNSWLIEKPPVVFWLSSFFFTQAFLTGAAQNFARRYTIPIDNVEFEFEMMVDDEQEVKPDNGVYTQGLYLEGARWDKEAKGLAESLPKVLFSPAPTMHWMPYKTEELPVYPHYKCPVYKTSDRRGVLATTGHSSNFVCFINIPSEIDQNHWVERGVAMLTVLDD
jgi:dynein heavy chain